VQDLAISLAEETLLSLPLTLLPPGDTPERHAAVHGLNVAMVLGRVARFDAEWSQRLPDAILAALLFDAGMSAMPWEILSHAGPLNDEQRRQIEAHVGLSAEAVKRFAPQEGWLLDAVRAHHERLDGTGYPEGSKGEQIPRLARLLAVCDMYTALASPRAHRPALSLRSALTQTLLEAEKGRLDTPLAELLLTLSFYPVGTVVELSDGKVGLVVATPTSKDLNATLARPVVQVLFDQAGKALALPQVVNLAQAVDTHVTRDLTAREGRELLSSRHWALL
jgi:HD-GYP domain-containing protein (c-di-GMP phosphodiesterase class II)